MTVHIWDEVIPGQLSPADAVLISQTATTARELTRSRVQQEVERHNHRHGAIMRAAMSVWQRDETILQQIRRS